MKTHRLSSVSKKFIIRIQCTLSAGQAHFDDGGGSFKKEQPVSAQTIRLFYTLISLVILTGCTHSPEKKFIAVNQVGYEKDSSKQACLVNAKATWFELIRTYDSKVVFSDSMKTPAEIITTSN